MSRSSFTTPLIVSPLPDGRKWRLFHQFTYHIGSRYSQKTITVPEGFVTDFASIPKFIFWVLPWWAKFNKASVLHDWLYQEHILTRAEADLAFYEAMLVAFRHHRTGPFVAWLEYWAVRLFGWMAWPRRKRPIPDNSDEACYDRFSNYARRTDI